MIINAAFSGGKYILPENVRAIFMRASVHVDEDQAITSSYKHAMRAPNQTVEEAERLMNNFIRQKTNKYKTLMSQGKTEEAYFALGMAMHPLMDATSPSHEGFQEWAGRFPVIDGTTKRAYIHGSRETVDVFNSNPDYSRRAVDSIRRLYDEANR